MRIYYFALWTDICDFLNPSIADDFFAAFKDVSPIKKDLEAEAMTTKILGVLYNTAWRDNKHPHPTSLLVEKRLALAVFTYNISNITTIEIVCQNIRKLTLDALVELVDMVRSYPPLSTASVMLYR